MDLNSVGFSVLAVSVLYFVTVRTKEEGLLLETRTGDSCFFQWEITDDFVTRRFARS